jgi:hypothetical protein
LGLGFWGGRPRVEAVAPYKGSRGGLGVRARLRSGPGVRWRDQVGLESDSVARPGRTRVRLGGWRTGMTGGTRSSVTMSEGRRK